MSGAGKFLKEKNSEIKVCSCYNKHTILGIHALSMAIIEEEIQVRL